MARKNDGIFDVTAPKLFSNLFLGIGAMKSGTTWLYAVLARHPALHFALEKEIHYFYHLYVDSTRLSEKNRLKEAKNRYVSRFDPEKANIDRIRENLRWAANYLDRPVDDLWYRNLFLLRDHQKFACDFSNLHALLPGHAWPRIAEKCGNLKVLYTMRAPLARLWSHTKFHLGITRQLQNLDSWDAPQFESFVRQPHIWKNAEYGVVLRNLKNGLAGEDYKVLFYEDLHRDQRRVLREIEEFLEIPAFDYPQAVLDMRLTESAKIEMPDFFPEIFEKDLERIQKEVEDAGYSTPMEWS